MKMPFTTDEFLNAFRDYNESIWPFQVFFYALALMAIYLVIKKGTNSNRIVILILIFFWVWMGIVYHMVFFSSINQAAFLFGSFFLLQGLLFLHSGLISHTIRFEFNLSFSGIVALIFIAYSLVVYPVVGYFQGHVYPQAPTFGVPCPTTIFTFGILLFSSHRIPWYIIIVPLLWSIIGFFAALNLGVKEDFGLVIAGLSSAIILLLKPKAQD